ncbi:Putative AC transposase [Frankliniella fusca]|uniref:AC transposase n=1 Tax=Frankliniella fusca TaxID=407009 RepID=A0AAE1LF62_9NEOP|nr:Putative AC transposase [Frankliniella fusca]
MANVDWKNYFQGGISKSSVTLWTAVRNYEVAGSKKFENIAGFVLKMLSAPLSNAAVERAFSIMNVTKPKLRNRLQTPMLEALLRAKLWARGVRCCAKFLPTTKMYDLFSKNIYDDDVGEEVLSEKDIDEIFVICE